MHTELTLEEQACNYATARRVRTKLPNSVCCPQCGMGFKPRSWKSVFCGKTCQYAAKRVVPPLLSTKRCSSCCEQKPRECFHASKSATTGLQAQCKACQHNRQRLRVYAKHKCVDCGVAVRWLVKSPAVEALRVARCVGCVSLRRLVANGGAPHNYTGTSHFTGKDYSAWVGSAKRRGYSWALTKTELDAICVQQKGKCALSGIDMQPRTRSPFRPSLDRIDSTKHYTIDNVQFVCSILNVMKNKLSDAEFVRLCRLVAEHRSDL